MTVTMLMALTAMLAIAMLSLGTVVLRGSRHGEARQVADSNARLALMLAMGELQKNLGDDRRITADGSILLENDNPEDPPPGSAMVGVWESDYSTISEDERGGVPDYGGRKDEHFLRWLISSGDPLALEDPDYLPPTDNTEAALLYSESLDGFDLFADLVSIGNQAESEGALAWAITQNGTKAQLNVGNARERRHPNDVLEAPTRPNVDLSGLASQPEDGWGRRRERILTMDQALLDDELAISRDDQGDAARAFTTSSYGVQADVTKGGLRKDMSLGFELEDSEFGRASLGNIPNPFASGSGPDSERPLFEPATDGSPVTIDLNYEVFNYPNKFKTGAPPTFKSLRSHYRVYKHTYLSNSGPTVFSRPVASSYYQDNAPRGTETGIQPVLDRLLMAISLRIVGGEMKLVLTPVITLWNPYNVAIEAEGFVAYPWMDIPLKMDWRILVPRESQPIEKSVHLSTFIGNKYRGQRHGRQETPYFYFQLTQGGGDDISQPIHLEPGEVRVFKPTDRNPIDFVIMPPAASEAAKFKVLTCRMAPAGGGAVTNEGGIQISMKGSFHAGSNIETRFSGRESVSVAFTMDVNNPDPNRKYHYHVSLEDAARISGAAQDEKILDAQVRGGTQGNSFFQSPLYSARELMTPSGKMVGVLETYHRTAAQGADADSQLSDIVYTVNPQQRYVNGDLSNISDVGMSPHYESDLREAADFAQVNFQTTPDGERSYYGESNAPATGRDYLSFFGLPVQAPVSMGAFQHANVMDTAFGPANAIGNSWASPYLDRTDVRSVLRRSAQRATIRPRGLGIYDGSYLINNVLWDGFFLSSISPETSPGSSGGADAWDSETVRVVRDLEDVIEDWVRDPSASPLRNSRNVLHKGGYADDEIIDRLTDSSGFGVAAAHLLTEGSFNVNSTNVEAWKAVLASLRGESFELQSGEEAGGDNATPFPRLSRPTGEANDQWNGFRQLTDDEIENFAEAIVDEVRDRGPFFSLGDFVNRRLMNDETGLKGALQAAIDEAGLNRSATVATFSRGNYPEGGNIPEADTGVGTPGWLTQADVLTSLAPVMSVRSDTFTIRGYGEAHNGSGQVIARACYEAVVQRLPEWVDAGDPPEAEIDDISEINERFGRRFRIVSTRQIANTLL